MVTPAQTNAELPSAKVISVGQLCPLRLVNHVFMTTDSAAFALALDALDHDGTASVSRVIPRVLSICTQVQAEDMEDNPANDFLAFFQDFLDGFV